MPTPDESTLPDLDAVTDGDGVISLVPSIPPPEPGPPKGPPPLPPRTAVPSFTVPPAAPRPSPRPPPPLPLHIWLAGPSPRAQSLVRLAEELRSVPPEGRKVLLELLRIGDGYGIPPSLLAALADFVAREP